MQSLLTELATRPASEQVEFIEALHGLRILTEREKDALRKRDARAESARVEIRSCENPQRRERAIADPERFMRTYFADRYKRPFGKLHYALIEALWEVAKTGGKQAVAAPRGRGKTEVVKGVIPATVFAGLIRFPVPIGPTTAHANELYEDFRRKCMYNDMLAADFPEVCDPIRALEGAPQRASRQHVDGELTHIIWKTERLRFPDVPEKYRGPINYGGVRMEFRGLDAAIRGINRDGDRPDFVPIDEPETRESSKSESQIRDRSNAIERDIAGLAGDEEELAQCMLTTIQNTICNSFIYTDPEQKPSWMGKRFGWVEKWPNEWQKDGVDGNGMWHEYIALRHKDQREGDRYGRTATQFFLDHEDEMTAGGELLADNYKAKVLSDGWQTVHSAWQVVFNSIADTDFDSFCTEYQNDPPEGEQIEQIQLTAAKVQARIVETGQREVPHDTGFETIGIDLGKYASHWSHTAWTDETCVGTVPDYGIMETTGLNAASDNKAIEHAIVAALEVWAEDVVAKIKPQLVLIDSGTFTDAAYTFCRNAGRPFFPAKGWDLGRFRMPEERTPEKIPYQECYAAWQPNHKLWLYHHQGEYWKSWMQSRFLQQPYDEQNERQPGSLALFNPVGDAKRHLSFSQHMVAEYERHVPKEGKQLKREWYVKNRNNHWLDGMALACCAAGVLGVRLMTQPPPPPPKKKPQPSEEPRETPFSRNGLPFLATQRR